MFADDICEHGVPDFAPSRMAPTLARIRQAHKFQLGPDFAAVADELRIDLSQIAKAIPLCRLPYELTWIEFAEAHRNRSVDYRDALRWTQAPVKRVGFLMMADGGNLARFTAYQFWQSAEGFSDGFKAAVHAAYFDMTDESNFREITEDGGSRVWNAASIEDRRLLSRIVESRIAEYSPPLSWALLSAHPTLLKTAATEAIYDWNGETAYIEAVLALLNARNTSQSQFIDKSEHNRKRVKRGQLPLFSHSILTIHPRQLARARQAQAASADGASLRAHFVRGHWKVRKSGIFFWSPHVRGDADKGIVDKDYKVA